MKSLRFKYARCFKYSFFIWHDIGWGREYYDAWINWINIGIIAISWLTPPLKGDFKHNDNQAE